ncbi:ABC transporter permease [Chthonobacter albigriseus]|uniref:ABC transporter permease n=1 Tax=Chthonobacter albigriseus TaxID=1683161 RepID=UPI001887F6B2|nr:ABC transporter permease [Chthonobacter albigriseus]
MDVTPPKRSRPRIDRFAVFWASPSLVWQVAFFVAPLVVLVWMTFWRVKNFKLEQDFIPDNWIRIFSSGFFYDAFLYTFWMALVAAVLITLIAFPAAYALAFIASPRTRTLAIVALITPFFTSYLVRIYSWQIILAEKGIINGVLGLAGISPVNIIGTSTATMVGYVTLALPLVLLIQLFSLSMVDKRLVEAAYNLGCGPLKTVFKVVVPSARVGLVIGGTFAFLFAFGDYVSPLFLGGSKPPTLSILITDQVKSGNNWPRAAVVAVVMVITLMATLTVMSAVAYRRRGGAR